MNARHAQSPRDIVDRIITWVGSIPSLMLHTFIFVVFFALSFAGFLSWDLMFLILTTVVSLEAIYLAIFIQMTVNRQAKSLREVEADVDEIQEDIDEIQEDIDEIQEDVEEMSEDIGEMTDDEREAERKKRQMVTLEALTADVKRLLADLEELKKS
ncbi:MAG: DUF1003 domain-containing protein [Patescibacteria group bacterium]|nr:DUF1003 domain-containing protein [Patescibacteria group bacterium]